MTSTAATSSSSTTLRNLLRDHAGRAAIRAHLDGLSPRERVREALTLSGGEVGKLYDACAGGPGLTAEDFAPADAGTDQTFIFEGRNSLPAFNSFQKRFARVPSGQVVGYNHQTMAFVTGPGFFVVREADEGAADVSGELYFDYTTIPDAFPAGWPRFKRNEAGLSYLVYAGMKDYMRSVATNVVVGRAYKGGKAQSAYFLLARADG